MAKIVLKDMGVNDIANRVSTQAREMNGVLSSVKSVLNNLDMDVSSRRSINRNLNEIYKDCRAHQETLNRLASFAIEAADKVERADKEVANTVRKAFFSETPTSTTVQNNFVGESNVAASYKETSAKTDNTSVNISENVIEEKKPNTKKYNSIIADEDIANGLEKYGLLGLIGSCYFYEKNAKPNSVNTGKAALNMLDMTNQNMYLMREHMIHMASGGTAGTRASFKDFIAPKLDTMDDFKYKSTTGVSKASKAANISQNISTSIKWGGVVLTAVDKLVGNAEEYDYDLKNPKLYIETAGETIIDTVLTSAAGTAVGIIAGSTAPIWAVATVSIGGVMLANTAVKALTGGDIAEHLSDGVIAVAETTVEVAKAAGKALKSAGKATKKAAKKVAKAAGKCLSVLGKAVKPKWF